MRERFKTQRCIHDRLLESLRKKEHQDGATVTMLNLDTKINQDKIRAALEEMHVAYIDRWGRIGSRGPTLSPIWMAVDVPEDCPKPDGVQ